MKNREHKTTSKLEKLRGIFFQIGLIIACGLTLVAFEWTSYTYDDLPEPTAYIDDVLELPPITYRIEKPKVKKVPPKVPSTIIALVDKDPIEVEEKKDSIIDEPDDFDPDVEVVTNEILPPTPIASRMPHYKNCASFSEEIERKECTEEILYKYLDENFKTPTAVLEMGGEFKAYVYFEVNKKGKIQNVKVQNEKRLPPLFTKEVLRVVSAMPQMIAGKHEGRKRVVSYSIPIVIDAN